MNSVTQTKEEELAGLKPAAENNFNSKKERTIELDQFLGEINRLETLIEHWDEGHSHIVKQLRKADNALHKEAITKIIKSVKKVPEAMNALKGAVSDELVYSVLRHLGIVKASLQERVEDALESVRPFLGSHGGNVELVELIPPNKVTIRLLGACDGCPASGLTLREGVEKAIKERCPEITEITKARGGSLAKPVDGIPVHFISPFANSEDEGWVYAAEFEEVPEKLIKIVTVSGNELILSRFDDKISCFQNACAHLGMPLDMGEIREGILICPHHAFEYSLESGECLTAPQVQLQTHAVRVVGNKVEVKLS
ncbi:MAG: NifU family protein [Enterobacterales bacterium]|nr:NifU family protein [Enterobacterales bacterium]